MFASSFQTSDVTGSAFAAATMGCFAAAALTALGLTWVSERWRVPVALAAVALGISALSYMSADELWLSGGKLSAGPRFAAWFAVHPLLVAATYFFVNIAGPVPAAPVNDLDAALDNPFVAERGLIRDYEHVRMVAGPVRDSAAEPPSQAAPAFGADTDAVLRDCGFFDGEIAALRADKVI